MSSSRDISGLIDHQKLLTSSKDKPFGPGHYRDHLSLIYEKFVEDGGNAETFRRITEAYYNAKTASREELIHRAKTDKLNIMANNPSYPDSKIVTEELGDQSNIVTASSKEEFKAIFACTAKIHSILEVGVPPVEGDPEWLANFEADHEEEHMRAFDDEPGAKVDYAIVFYKDKVTGERTMYPGVQVSGEFSLGSYRRCYDVKTPSVLDVAASTPA